MFLCLISARYGRRNKKREHKNEHRADKYAAAYSLDGPVIVFDDADCGKNDRYGYQNKAQMHQSFGVQRFQISPRAAVILHFCHKKFSRFHIHCGNFACIMKKVYKIHRHKQDIQYDLYCGYNFASHIFPPYFLEPSRRYFQTVRKKSLSVASVL